MTGDTASNSLSLGEGVGCVIDPGERAEYASHPNASGAKAPRNQEPARWKTC